MSLARGLTRSRGSRRVGAPVGVSSVMQPKLSVVRTPLMTALRHASVLLLATAALALPTPAVVAAAQAPPRCDGRPATMVGTARADVLRGTSGPDVIVARAGDDIVKGLGGDDVICGGDGADRIQGGGGDDRVFGQRDAIRSDRGGTYRRSDLIDGGAGDDLLDVGADGRRVDQDGPFGTVTYGSARVGVSVDLATDDGVGTATGVGRDRIVVVPVGRCGGPPCFGMVVEGSSHDDTLLGSAGPDHLLGGWGDDRLDGRDGDDELDADGRGTYDGPDADIATGGAGADRILSWRGADVLDGGDGDDQVGSFAAAAAEVRGGAGDDDVLTAVTRPGFVLDGGDGHDTALLARPASNRSEDPGPVLVVTMAEGTVARDGNLLGTIAGLEEVALDDHLRWHYLGTDERDVLTGGYYWPLRAETFGGDDEVTGSGERDRIDAGEGADTVDGQEGRDTCLNAEVVTSCEVLTA